YLGHVEGQPALIIPASAIKLWLGRFALLCFAAGGVTLALTAPAVRVIGIGCALLFGSVAGGALRRPPRHLPIALLPGGLEWRMGGAPAYLDWDDVVAADALSVRDSYYLALRARPEAIRAPRRRFARIDRAFSGLDASITLEPFPVEPDQLVA